MWEVEFTDEFEAWWDNLDENSQAAVKAAVDRLEQTGPSLGRPIVGEITGSTIHNLKELRPAGTSIRVLFVFDPRRAAILLLGADKADHGFKDWYRGAITQAEELYAEYLQDLKKEGLI